MRTYQQKDIDFIKTQDRLAFYNLYSICPIRFVDRIKTDVDKLGSQDIIYLHDILAIPIWIKRDSLQKIQDRLNLRELPEAVAYISVAVLESLITIPNNNKIVEPDVLIQFGNVLYRIKDAFQTSHIDNYPDIFMHYECILERNTRVNYYETDMNINIIASIII